MAEIAGLKLITPSSVAGSGVSLSGAKVVFTAATDVSVNGVFDSTYDNYLIVMRHVCSTGNPYFRGRLRVSGVDATTNYTLQYVFADDTSETGLRQTSQTSAPFGVTSATQRSGDHVYLYGPALAQPTAWRNVNVYGYLDASLYDLACTHSTATAYDGFTLFVSSGNVTGALTVYGLSQ